MWQLPHSLCHNGSISRGFHTSSAASTPGHTIIKPSASERLRAVIAAGNSLFILRLQRIVVGDHAIAETLIFP